MMKKLLILLFILINGITYSYSQTNNKDWDNLIKAISIAESNQQTDIVSKCGRYVGLLQISKIAVRDCNRILKEINVDNKTYYKYNDRFSEEKSIEMFNIIQCYYNPEKDIEKAIRLWKGGCNYSNSNTEQYYQKVLKLYEKLD